MSCTSDVETESRSDDAIATSGEAPQRSFKKSTAVPLARAKQSALGEVHVDSDWAGDQAMRRSRSGVIVRRGLHLLKHISTVQNVIGLSGAESEYYALTKGGC